MTLDFRFVFFHVDTEFYQHLLLLFLKCLILITFLGNVLAVKMWSYFVIHDSFCSLMYLFFLSLSVVIIVCGVYVFVAHTSLDAHVEVRAQFMDITLSFHFAKCSKGSNSGWKACVAYAFTCWANSPAFYNIFFDNHRFLVYSVVRSCDAICFVRLHKKALDIWGFAFHQIFLRLYFLVLLNITGIFIALSLIL